MFSYLHPWQTHTHLLPYVHPPPAPPPLAHKVWILDCKSCGTFITNRAMKAVLLLSPSIHLFSSDALPINCSAYSSNPSTLRPPAACPSSSSHRVRTCECLTQTLCCHGCGSAIGYMIVIPCARCTSSISSNNRATNGHRFVFHSSEIKGTERHYIPDEPGVILPAANTAAPSPPILPPYSASALHNGLHNRLHRPPVFYPHHSTPREYLPTPPLDVEEDVSPASSGSPSPSAPSFPFLPDSSHLYLDSPLPHSLQPIPHSDHFHTHYPHSTRVSDPPRRRPTSAASSESSNSSPPPLIQAGHTFGLPAEHFEAPALPPLHAGDVMYWHHLARHGEIPGVMEDARARRRSLAINVGKTRVLFDR